MFCFLGPGHSCHLRLKGTKKPSVVTSKVDTLRCTHMGRIVFYTCSFPDIFVNWGRLKTDRGKKATPSSSSGVLQRSWSQKPQTGDFTGFFSVYCFIATWSLKENRTFSFLKLNIFHTSYCLWEKMPTKLVVFPQNPLFPWHHKKKENLDNCDGMLSLAKTTLSSHIM